MDFGNIAFHDRMAVGAAGAKPVDTRPKRLVWRDWRPFLRSGGYLKLLIERLHAGIHVMKMLVGRDCLVLHRKQCLHHSRNTGSCIA